MTVRYLRAPSPRVQRWKWTWLFPIVSWEWVRWGWVASPIPFSLCHYAPAPLPSLVRLLNLQQVWLPSQFYCPTHLLLTIFPYFSPEVSTWGYLVWKWFGVYNFHMPVLKKKLSHPAAGWNLSLSKTHSTLLNDQSWSFNSLCGWHCASLLCVDTQRYHVRQALIAAPLMERGVDGLSSLAPSASDGCGCHSFPLGTRLRKRGPLMAVMKCIVLMV